MTPADILRMAEEAGLRVPYWGEGEDPAIDPPHWAMPSPLPPLLERFAALVAAHEREACAKVCDEKAKRNFTWGSENSDRYHAQADWAESCAKAIRARGKSHE